jgi:hypothetical protein
MVTGQCRFNRIGGVIVKVLASSAVDREFKELFDNNIIFIKDILDEENKFKTYDELKNQFNCKLNFLK